MGVPATRERKSGSIPKTCGSGSVEPPKDPRRWLLVADDPQGLRLFRMNQPTDGELLESWRSGDGSAFRELVERHQAVLLHHARSILGRGQGAEDAVQEALLELANRPPELAREVSGNPQAERAQLLSWLHRVTRNKTMDTIRS